MKTSECMEEMEPIQPKSYTLTQKFEIAIFYFGPTQVHKSNAHVSTRRISRNRSSTLIRSRAHRHIYINIYAYISPQEKKKKRVDLRRIFPLPNSSKSQTLAYFCSRLSLLLFLDHLLHCIFRPVAGEFYSPPPPETPLTAAKP